VRFLDPDEGAVLIGGRDVREYAQEAVRAAVRLSAQDARLFATTIRENVRIGNAAADADAVRNALAVVGLGDWLATLPDGLDTQVGEGGARVSGGQRQRIAVARALISNARILLLDEPTAHLDPHATHTLLADLRRAAPQAAVLVVTHSPAGLEAADEIVVLDGGRIRERGHHARLVADGGWYADMVSRCSGADRPA
jgi:ABC-type multidrug transport system fused ATPase/permease subunit